MGIGDERRADLVRADEGSEPAEDLAELARARRAAARTDPPGARPAARARPPPQRRRPEPGAGAPPARPGGGGPASARREAARPRRGGARARRRRRDEATGAARRARFAKGEAGGDLREEPVEDEGERGSDGTSQSSVIASRQGSGSRWGTKARDPRRARGPEPLDCRRAEARESAAVGSAASAPSVPIPQRSRASPRSGSGSRRPRARGEELLLGARGTTRSGAPTRAARRARVRVAPMPIPHRKPDRRARRNQALADPRLVAEERREPAEVDTETARLDHLEARRSRPRGIEERPGRDPLGGGSARRPTRSGTRVAASVALMPARTPPAAASGVTAMTVRMVAPWSAATGRPQERRVLPDQCRCRESRRPDAGVARRRGQWGRGHPRPPCAAARREPRRRDARRPTRIERGPHQRDAGARRAGARSDQPSLGREPREQSRATGRPVDSPRDERHRDGGETSRHAARAGDEEPGPRALDRALQAHEHRRWGAAERPGRQLSQIDRDQLESATLDEDVRGPPRGGESAAAANPEETAQRDPDHRGRRRIEPVRAIDERRPAAARGERPRGCSEESACARRCAGLPAP